jgi:hypothetical protein
MKPKIRRRECAVQLLTSAALPATAIDGRLTLRMGSPKADIGTQPRDVRFVPKADIRARHALPLMLRAGDFGGGGNQHEPQHSLDSPDRREANGHSP